MKKIWILILTILVLVSVGMVIGHNVSYQYTPQGNMVNIFTENLCDISNYDYDEQECRFDQNGDDPNFYLKGMSQVCGGIKIVLKEEADEDIPVQIFYAHNEDEYLSENHSNTSMIKAGSKECDIKIPVGQYQVFRLDMDGNFSIDEIFSYDQAMLKSPIITNETTRSGLVALPVFIIFYLLLFWAHNKNRKEKNILSYMKSILEGNTLPAGKRQIHLDYLRVFAAILIIISHSVSNEMASTAEGSLPRLLFVAILTLGVCCNVIYVMISGHLLLASKAEIKSIGDFYCRRVSRVVIPLITYYLFLLYLNQEIDFFPPRNLAGAVKSMLSGPPDVAPHFWLLYTMVALYLVTPIFHACVKNLSDKILGALCIVMLFMNALTTYLPLAGIMFGVNTFLAGWEGVFIMGYAIQKDSFKKYDKAMIAAAVVSYVVSLSIMFHNYGMMNFIYVCAPPTVITTCGIFAFIRQKIKWFSKDSFFLRMCSKYSFSILMIHWYTLFVVAEGKCKLSVMRGHVIGGLVATNVVAFAASLVFVILFDNTIVIICNALFDQLVTGCSFIKNKLKIEK